MFIFRSASVNLAASKTLMPENLYVHRTSGFTYEGLVEALDDAAMTWKFQTFPDFVEEKQLGDLEEQLSMVQDGMKYWDKLKEFTEVFLSLYYKSSEDVVKDQEICDFWKMVNSMPVGPREHRGEGTADGFGYKLPELNSGKGAFGNLVDYLCHVIFTVTANHELLGSVIEYFTTPAGLTTKIWDESYQEEGYVNKIGEGGQCMTDAQTFIQSTSVISMTGYRQPPLICDWATHMHIQDGDEDKWSDFVLDQQQIDRLRDYLQALGGDPHPAEPMLGCNGLANALNPCDYRRGREKRLASVEASLHALEYRSSHNVQLHNHIIDNVHRSFMEGLLQLSRDIETQNSSREIPFQAFNPSLMECSVSI